MPKTVYITEKPSVAQTLAAFLKLNRKDGYYNAGDVYVTWCLGHLLELAPPDAYNEEYQRWAMDHLPIIPSRFTYNVTARGRKQYKCINDLLSSAAVAVIATDLDREGEVIGREVIQRAKFKGRVQRLWPTSLDNKGLALALKTVREGQETEPYYLAGLARGQADWLVGMNLTRAFTLLGRSAGYGGVLSVGRVQTPTLNLVVQRDRAIDSFVPHDYYTLFVTCGSSLGAFQAQWQPGAAIQRDDDGRCTNRTAAETMAQQVLQQLYDVTGATFDLKHESPPLPYDLSTLLTDASSRLGMDASDVQDIAQSLYEHHKATTYPRTESGYLPQALFDERQEVVAALASADPTFAALIAQADLRLHSAAWNDNKVVPHHGIIPTISCDMGQMSDSERAVFDLIRRRYLAQFFPNLQYEAGRIELRSVNERFVATGRTIIEPGWKKVIAPDKADPDAEPMLPKLVPGQSGTITAADIKASKTKPKPHYTKGTLIQAMKNIAQHVTDPQLRKVLRETTGIGTTATRTSIIDGLIAKGLLVKQKNKLISAPAGRALIDILPNALKDPAMTAIWEQALDQIAQGHADLASFMQQQSTWVRQLVTFLQTHPINLDPVKALAVPCPTCKEGTMQRRKGSNGYFFGCTHCAATLDERGGRPVDRGAKHRQSRPRKTGTRGKRAS